jgi:hypothetical protein
MEEIIVIIVIGTIKSLLCYIDDNDGLRSYTLQIPILS